MPKAFLVAESQILAPEAVAQYVGPAREALIAAGGRPAVVSSIGGRIIPLTGEPLTNLVISEWESVAAVRGWLASSALARLEPLRARACRVIR